MENSEVFATRLKELRGKITQGRLGEALGVSRGSVSFYENGERTPDADFLIKASRYFNVSTDYLLGLSEFKNQEAIDGLINRLTELDELKTMEKAMSLANKILAEGTAEDFEDAAYGFRMLANSFEILANVRPSREVR